MAVVIVTRLKGNENFGPTMQRAAGILKKHGAISVRGGRCHAGSYAGQIVVATALADWSAYGRLMQGLTTDPDWLAFYAEASKLFELQDRSLIEAQDF
jgi:hypothetical protein